MFNSFFARWAEIIIRIRMLVLVVVFALTAFFAWAISEYMIVENSFDTFFPKNDPNVADFDRFNEIFGTKNFIFILVETEKPLSIDTLKKVDALTRDLEENVPYVDDVVSPTNAEILVGSEDSIEVNKLRDHFDDPKRFEALVELFSKKAIYKNGIISADKKHLGILLNTVSRDTGKVGGMDITVATERMTEAVYAVLAKPDYESFKLYPVGGPIFNDQYGKWTNSETYRMFSWIVLILVVTLAILFRSPRGVIIPVLTVIFTTIWTFGLISLLIKLRVTSTILPPLLCAVGICDSIHILTEFDAIILKLGDRRKAIIETMRVVGYPCLLTSITTAAGFMSLSLAPVLPLEETGIFAAAGIIIAFLLTVTMVIAALSFGGDTEPQRESGAKTAFSFKLMERIFSFVDRRKRQTIVIWFLSSAFFAAGLTMIVIDADWLRNFSEDVRIRRDYEYADSIIGGSASFELMIDTGEKNGVKDPEFLAEIDRFSSELSRHPGMNHILSVVDLMKEVRKSLFGEDENEYRAPESRAMAAQLMLLYDMAGGEALDEMVDGKKQRARITVRVPFESDGVWRAYRKTIMDLLEKHISVPSDRIIVTGHAVMEIAITELVMPSQVKSFSLAFFAIGILLVIFLRSIPLGVVGMIPTTLPVLFALGFMGWWGIYLDWVIIMIASIGIGLSVDNAIHLFNRFRYEFEREGNHREAMRLALMHVGRALAFSAFILGTGFVICATSVMENVANFGRLSVLLIVVSFLAAVTLAPALLVWIKPFGEDRR